MAEILAVSVTDLVKTYSSRSASPRSGRRPHGSGRRTRTGRAGRGPAAFSTSPTPSPTPPVRQAPPAPPVPSGDAARPSTTPDGRIRAVDELSLTVPTGTVTALLGPNGAGKTTTVEICEGFRRPDAGEVRVLGLDPWADAVALRPRVGVMLQSGGMYPGARAGEMLRLVASHYRHPLDPAALLDRLGLAGSAGTPFRRLSGGQQQRLSLAMAVVGRPELVFLDEPTAGLDVQGRRDTWELVEELRTAGVTVVLTTHAMDEAERLADQVIIVDHGRVVAVGSPAELTRGGAEGQLRFRAPAGLDLGRLLLALPDGTTVQEGPAGHYLLQGTVDPQLLAAVTAWCAGNGILAEDLRVEQRTLEDVFVELTGSELRS
ncbi:ABC transporter ATP-binding protein [Frankia casuarinae]|uniref:ABC transporter related n=1 Tax=Frankia casuarinae (strain DSM 45818 / CECT 9043 / HFP020203 / CcI3) TaxID=106370 RepID=Q2JCG1_FRACC|nr:ABC transporter ATP-binding protein [Frankia casuarinae]ABD11031.1 ABC transporter related [Frankia casuarinae]